VKAAAFFEYGPPEVLRFTDVADPDCGPQDVLVRVEACGLNHSDLDSRAGTSRWPFALPMVLGAEFVGTVAEVGSEVQSIRRGELVTALLQYSCGRCEACARWRADLCKSFEIFGTTRWGGYGELVSVPARAALRLRPEDDPLTMAAAQCSVSTAWHMVNGLAGVRPGDFVLVPSASGGVASALVQCSKLVGAYTVATVGAEEKAAAVMALGADAVVCHRRGDLASALLSATGGRRFDAVLDTVAGELFPTHLSLLREDGCLVTCGAHAGEVVPLDVIPLFRNGWRILGFRVAPPEELEVSLDVVRQGAVKVPIAATFPVSDAAAAHRFLEERRHVGKVLLVKGSL
jgi:NADPH:quinone reductase-like Zn-dependent oxidoreductase